MLLYRYASVMFLNNSQLIQDSKRNYKIFKTKNIKSNKFQISRLNPKGSLKNTEREKGREREREREREIDFNAFMRKGRMKIKAVIVYIKKNLKRLVYHIQINKKK